MRLESGGGQQGSRRFLSFTTYWNNFGRSAEKSCEKETYLSEETATPVAKRHTSNMSASGDFKKVAKDVHFKAKSEIPFIYISILVNKM